MPRPKLLDLCCRVGGASMGYHRAGFDVIGVDIEPIDDYPFEFIQADIRDLDRDWVAGFAVHRRAADPHHAGGEP